MNTPTPTQARALAHYLPMAAQAVAPRRFTTVYCSQCGNEFTNVDLDGGYSQCSQHRTHEVNAAIFAKLWPAPARAQQHRETDEDRAYDIVASRADDRDFLCERGL